jgi:hypothetical protein
MKNLLLLLLSLTTLAVAQITPPPPVMLTTLPPNVTQTLVTSGSSSCAAFDSNDKTPGCTQLAGANWFLVQHGASGGSHYDATGNLFIGIGISGNPAPSVEDPNGGSTQEISAIYQMAPNGTFTNFLGAPPYVNQTCTLTSSGSAEVYLGPNLFYIFSVNPISNALYVVTQNVSMAYYWNPTVVTPACGTDGNIEGLGNKPYYDYVLTTYALIELTGSGI